MNIKALAIDYDGTLASEGVVDERTVTALRKFKATGKKLFLVTGRELLELLNLFPESDVFDVIVAENGALLHYPQTQQQILLTGPPPLSLIYELLNREIAFLSIGRCIIATRKPYDSIVKEILPNYPDLSIAYNNNSVMILPGGVNKASGLITALEEFNINIKEVAAAGDAENDIDFLEMSGLPAAVDNAIPEVKSVAKILLKNPSGSGVQEFIETILNQD